MDNDEVALVPYRLVQCAHRLPGDLVRLTSPPLPLPVHWVDDCVWPVAPPPLELVADVATMHPSAHGLALSKRTFEGSILVVPALKPVPGITLPCVAAVLGGRRRLAAGELTWT